MNFSGTKNVCNTNCFANIVGCDHNKKSRKFEKSDNILIHHHLSQHGALQCTQECNVLSCHAWDHSLTAMIPQWQKWAHGGLACAQHQTCSHMCFAHLHAFAPLQCTKVPFSLWDVHAFNIGNVEHVVTFATMSMLM